MWAAGYSVFFAALAESGPSGRRNWPGRWLPRPCWWGRGQGGLSDGEIISLCCIGGALYLWWLIRSPIRAA